MAVGKRIYLKRNMPDPEVMEQFKNDSRFQHLRRNGKKRGHESADPSGEQPQGPDDGWTGSTVKAREAETTWPFMRL